MYLGTPVKVKVRTEAASYFLVPANLIRTQAILFIIDLGPEPSFKLMRNLVWTCQAVPPPIFYYFPPEPCLNTNLLGAGAA